ncbi:MAG: hypothetical protein DRJ03_24020 [Chloroflexi bacterium]|nr:MAG: hypothetical protein DRJ03_24020 [Chloroflexota bacterium]
MIDVADSNAVYYYHYDGLGSVAAISNANGNLVEKYVYDVFGSFTIYDANDTQLTESSVGNPYYFTGRRYDSETELYYYRARYYNPELGRFMQTDPIGYTDGINWYAYCGNNSINIIDPYGLIGFWERTGVLFSTGPIDSYTMSKYSKISFSEAEIMTSEIITNSVTPVTSDEKNSIQNAVLHGLVSSYFYRHVNEEDATQALNIHELPENRSNDFDTSVDEANNRVGKSIGLSNGNIYDAVKDTYYREYLYHGQKDIFGIQMVKKLKPLRNYNINELTRELQEISGEINNLVDEFSSNIKK